MADIRARLLVDTKDAKKSVDGLKGAFKALVAAASIQQFVSLGDEFTMITNRLKSVSDSSDEASKKFALVDKVAKQTRSGLGPVADLFTDLTIATEDMGLSQERVAGVAGTFSKALKISGADANATSGAIRQFGQALASGVLRGDEFNSIMEANPAFMREVAKTLGVNVGQLREMAAEGKLTSDVIVKATEEISGAIDEDFGKTVATVSESITNLRNEFVKFVGKVNENTGVMDLFSKSIDIVAENLDILAIAMAAALGAAVAGRIASIVSTVITLSKAFRAAAVSGAILQGVTGVGLVKVIGGLTAAGGALALMDEIFEDSAANTSEIEKELDKIAKSSADNEESAKEALDASSKRKEEEKEIKKEQDEQARLLADQLEDFKAITGELKLGRDELQTQLDLQNDLIFATEQERDVIRAVADLESQRGDALRDLNNLTLISADERQKKEAEINDEFDERIRLTEEQIRLQNSIVTIGTQFRAVMDLVRDSITGATMDLEKQSAILNANSVAEREALIQQFNLRKNITDKELQLQQDIAQKELELAQSLGIKRTELNEDQKEQVRALFKDQEEQIAAALIIYDMFSKQIIEKFLEIREAGRTFAQGFKDAFIEFRDEVENMANFGRRIFDTMAQGFEDAIVNFVETGKLSFKDLFKTLLMEIIKMQANKLFLALFSPGTGLFGNLFAGFFNKGGTIPAGKIGIAGENGPEIIRGPGTVISSQDTAQMMGGTTNVVYNIQAVDAPSFQQLVARDPEFIFNVSRAGARRTPIG